MSFPISEENKKKISVYADFVQRTVKNKLYPQLTIVVNCHFYCLFYCLPYGQREVNLTCSSVCKKHIKPYIQYTCI